MLTLGYPFSGTAHLICETGSLICSELTDSIRQAGQRVQGSQLSPISPRLRLQAQAMMPGFFTWVVGSHLSLHSCK